MMVEKQYKMYTYINLIDKTILLKINAGLNAAQITIVFLKYTLFGVYKIERKSRPVHSPTFC